MRMSLVFVLVVPRYRIVVSLNSIILEKTRSCYTGDEIKLKQQKRKNKRNLASKVWSPSREASRQNTSTRESIDRQNMSDTEQAYAGAAAPVQVITAARNLNSQPFIPWGWPHSHLKSLGRLARRNRMGIQIFQDYGTARQERCTHYLWWERNRSPREKFTKPNRWR